MKKKILSVFILLLTLTACFATATFTASATDKVAVTFYLEQNTVYEEQEVSLNGYASVPATPAKNGSIFLYWSTTPNGDTRFSFATPISGDTELYAVWDTTVKYYTVTFIADGKIINVQEVEEGAAVSAPALVPAPEGKVFDGWDKTPSELSAVTEDITVNAVFADKGYEIKVIGFDGSLVQTLTVNHGQNVDESLITPPEVPHYDYVSVSGNLQNVTANGEIYLEYVPETLTVKFYADAELAEFEPISVKYNSTVAMPTQTPSKVGFVFIGWYENLDDAEMYNFSTVVEESFNLYAKFIPLALPKYQVRFFTFDGVQYGGTQMVEENSSAIRPGNPYREGYEFVDWNADFSNVTADIDVYPIYRIKAYTVTVVDGDVQTPYTVNYGGSVVEPKPLNKTEGYEFIRWDGSFKNIKSDVTITAEYRIKSFAVMFFTAEMKKIGVTQYVEYGAAAETPVLADKVGYTFKGWLGDGDPSSIKEDCAFVANFEKNSYAVTFMEGNTQITAVTVSYGDRVNPHEYVKPDGERPYVFQGWYVDGAFSELYDFNTPVVGGFELYAKWELEPEKTYKVTFVSDGQTIGERAVVENTNASYFFTPSKQGYAFKGWSVDTGDIANVTCDIVATAQFEINKYVVTFVYGDDQKSTVTVDYATAATAPENVNKTGYDFTGWDKAFDEVTADVTVNAIYTIKTFKIELYTDGSSQTPTFTQTVNYGGYVNIVTPPSVEGYTFLKWNTEKGEGFVFSTVVTESFKLYAEYKVNEYEVYYYVNGVQYGEPQLIAYGATLADALIEPPVSNDDVVYSDWKGYPEKMPARPIIVTASSYGYFNVSYYANGELFTTVRVLEGEAIPEMTLVPDGLPEHIAFVSWGEAPEVMPNRDVRVDAQVRVYEYYNVYYYVANKLYKTVAVLEGVEIPEMTETPTGLAENVVFVSWDEAPYDVMPNNDVRIDAQVRVLRYFNVYYYINADLFKTVKVLETKQIPEMTETPIGLPETIVFNGWGEAPYDEMPSEDVTIKANVTVLSYFNVNYYVGNELFKTVKVLQGRQFPVMDEVPTDLPETLVFVSWGDAPYTEMPDKDVRIDAVTRTLSYYNVNYYVNGTLFKSVSVLEGALIPEMTETPAVDGYIFEGWSKMESDYMPNNDVRVDAIMSRIPLTLNKVELTVTQTANGVRLTLAVKENVNFAGILGSIKLSENGSIRDYNYDETACLVYVPNGESNVNFVWSKGENTDVEVEIFTLDIDGVDGQPLVVDDMVVSQMTAIDADGNLVSVDCTVQIIMA